jgi:hypothetical protein
MNSWLEHVKKYRQKHPNLSYKECLQKAKTTYKKGGTMTGGTMTGGKRGRPKKGGMLLSKMKNYQKEQVKKAMGGTMTGGKTKKRGRPKKMKGGNIFDDITKGLGAVAPFIPLLL